MEVSYELINEARKYLRFAFAKNEMRTKLLCTFTNFEYLYLKNVYKYILMFLSTAAFVSQQQALLQAIELKQITVQRKGLEVSSNLIYPAHLSTYEQLLEKFADTEKNKLLDYKKVIKTQLLPKLLWEYMDRP